jgi:4,5-dihydroxyphthalate decarboxylase
MAKLNLTIATWDYDRVRSIVDGHVPIEGCEIKFLTLATEECFRRAYGFHEFEVSEIGFGPYSIAYALKQTPYVAFACFSFPNVSSFLHLH